jgi:hypothetical protein
MIPDSIIDQKMSVKEALQEGKSRRRHSYYKKEKHLQSLFCSKEKDAFRHSYQSSTKTINPISLVAVLSTLYLFTWGTTKEDEQPLGGAQQEKPLSSAA